MSRENQFERTGEKIGSLVDKIVCELKLKEVHGAGLDPNGEFIMVSHVQPENPMFRMAVIELLKGCFVKDDDEDEWQCIQCQSTGIVPVEIRHTKRCPVPGVEAFVVVKKTQIM